MSKEIKNIKADQLAFMRELIREVMSEEGKGLWHNIRAKRARGEKPSHPNSKAFKSAVKAGKEILKKEIAEPALEKDVDPYQLQLGIEEEMEHTNDRKVAKKIALDHLGEDKKYYTKLKNAMLKFVKPNFNFEWNEALRYPEFEEMGKQGWVDVANQGKPTSYSSIEGKLGNVDLDFGGLEKAKKDRFENAYKKGVIEMPIAVKFSENDYDLVAGNTRLSGLSKNGAKDAKIWVVDLSK